MVKWLLFVFFLWKTMYTINHDFIKSFLRFTSHCKITEEGHSLSEQFVLNRPETVHPSSITLASCLFRVVSFIRLSIFLKECFQTVATQLMSWSMISLCRNTLLTECNRLLNHRFFHAIPFYSVKTSFVKTNSMW